MQSILNQALGCRTCKGSGTVPIQQKGPDGTTQTIRVPCPVCGGSKKAGLRTK